MLCSLILNILPSLQPQAFGRESQLLWLLCRCFIGGLCFFVFFLGLKLQSIHFPSPCSPVSISPVSLPCRLWEVDRPLLGATLATFLKQERGSAAVVKYLEASWHLSSCAFEPQFLSQPPFLFLCMVPAVAHVHMGLMSGVYLVAQTEARAP